MDTVIIQTRTVTSTPKRRNAQQQQLLAVDDDDDEDTDGNNTQEGARHRKPWLVVGGFSTTVAAALRHCWWICCCCCCSFLTQRFSNDTRRRKRTLLLFAVACGGLTFHILLKRQLASSNFIIALGGGRVDLSPIVVPLVGTILPLFHDLSNNETLAQQFFYWKSVRLVSTADDNDKIIVDCWFDLWHVRHKGGQGYLYPGVCEELPQQQQNATTAKQEHHPVLLKSLTGWHVLETAKPEADATEWMSQQRPTTTTDQRHQPPLRLMHHGLNFLIVQDLKPQGYRPIRSVYRKLTSESAQSAFLHQLLVQILDQLQWLHQRYLHLDVWLSNILVRNDDDDNNDNDHQPEWQFQLIDYSSSLGIDHHMAAVRRSFRGGWHLPKLPALACPCRIAGSQRYCQATASSSSQQGHICPQFLDAFALAVNVMKLSNFHQETVAVEDSILETIGVGRRKSNGTTTQPSSPLFFDIKLPKPFTFDDVVQRYEEYRVALKHIQQQQRQQTNNTSTNSVLDRHTVALLTQLIDLDQLNTTLVCPCTPA